ncbi:MAG: 50S ribosomal protein L33 [Candidatus Omnitrophica bacterium]|nr:50S ribosomal protein L33 [Candidatus Omnitrophota bacterium]
MREPLLLSCTECKNRWYSTTKNKKNTTERLELQKFCRFCRRRTPHKEAK